MKGGRRGEPTWECVRVAVYECLDMYVCMKWDRNRNG